MQSSLRMSVILIVDVGGIFVSSLQSPINALTQLALDQAISLTKYPILALYVFYFPFQKLIYQTLPKSYFNKKNNPMFKQFSTEILVYYFIHSHFNCNLIWFSSNWCSKSVHTHIHRTQSYIVQHLYPNKYVKIDK